MASESSIAYEDRNKERAREIAWEFKDSFNLSPPVNDQEREQQRAIVFAKIDRRVYLSRLTFNELQK